MWQYKQGDNKIQECWKEGEGTLERSVCYYKQRAFRNLQNNTAYHKFLGQFMNDKDDKMTTKRSLSTLL